MSKIKPTIYALTFLLGLTLATYARAAITVRPALNSGLVAYWAMNEGEGTQARDSSGNQKNGTIYGASWTSGKFGSGLQFANGNYVQAAHHSDFNLAGDFTISVWVKRGVNDNFGTIIGKDSASGANGYFLRKGTSAQNHQVCFEWHNQALEYRNICPASGLPLNQWVFITITRSNDVWTIYLDGAYSNSNNNSETIYQNSADFFVGKLGNYNGQYFIGSIDSLRIYNRALSDFEVKQLYYISSKAFSSAKQTSNKGLVAYWSFEEGTGSGIGDMSGQGKNATASGSLIWSNGKRGKALSFNGTNDYIDAGNVYNGVKTISFWIKSNTTTNRILDLNDTAKVELSNGTITTSGIMSPTIYVDGAASSTLDANWHYVMITTATGIDASSTTFGKSWNCGEALVDSRNAKSYATVQIGNQCWMKQNINIGTRINANIDQDGYSGTTCTAIDKYCYSDTSANCDSNIQGGHNYPDGGLYQWNQMMCGAADCNGTGQSQPACSSPVQGICPTGWHIPSHYEYTALERAVCTSGSCATDFPYDTTTVGFRGTDEGNKLKPNGSSGWESNLSGYGSSGFFGSRSSNGYFWLSSKYDSSNAWDRVFYSGVDGFIDRGIDDGISYGFSVRCLKDNISSPYFSGKLDEVRMYNKVLSTTEVASSYQTSGKKTTINSSQNSQATTGLVGLWSFNGPDISGSIAYDRSGQGNNGTINGAKKTIGKIGQAITFDGVDDYIYSNNLISRPENFSISAWFKTASSSGKKIVGFESDKTGEASTNWDRQIYMGTDGKVRFAWFSGSTNEIVSLSTLNDNNWHHVVGTHSSNNIGFLYIDGIEQGNAGNAAQDYNGYWRIGGYRASGFTNSLNGYFPGSIDEVRVYSRPLSADEVKRLYKMGS